jgi:hypothetical protein
MVETIRIYIKGNERQPLLDGARKLLAQGHSAHTMLEVWREGAHEWSMRAPLGVAARYTVAERANGLNPPHFEPYRPGPSAREGVRIPPADDAG